jgi:hypothetical protein
MSLHHIAKHLKDQGRGPDDMLVHMTSGEVKALQGLAQAHGGSLTINPKTGLPEAGFLSSVLPMAVGALAVATGQVEFLPLIAAGVGAADYAMTGSLTQGLMAGLGTWSGGTLAGGLEAAGAQGLVESGGNLGETAFNTSQAQIAQQFPTATTESVNQVAAQQALTPQNFPNLTPEQLSSMQGSVLNSANPADIVKAAGQGSASLGSNVVNPTFGENLSNMGGGLSNIGSVIKANPGAAVGAVAPLLLGSDLLGKKTNAAPGSTAQKNPFGLKEIPRDANGNPIFNASLPAQPNPAYKPTYPNYQTNPYTPVGAASGGVMKMAIGGSAPMIGDQNTDGSAGGLANTPYVQQSQNQPSTANGYTPAGGGSTYGQGQYSPQTMAMPTMGLAAPYNQMGMPPAQFAQGGIAQYAGNYGSMVSGLNDIQEGVDTATKRRLMETPTPDFGDMREDTDLAPLDSYNRAQALLKKHLTASHVKPAKGLPKTAVLGALDMTPAAQAAAEAKAKESIAKDASTEEAKSGGLMSYANGGSAIGLDQNNLSKALAASASAPQSHIYQPTYPDYTVNPFNMQQASYNPQTAPAPSGLPMPAQNGAVGSQGYRIDPKLMHGTPEYQAEQDRIAAEKAAQEAIQFPLGGPIENAAGGGLMGYATGGHLGDYSDGGRLLRGPGDGVSDSIPATIGGKQPARLAEGEFVIPARIVSELGNGSTDAGAKRLYAMMDRIKAKRAKTKNIAANTKAYKYLPA